MNQDKIHQHTIQFQRIINRALRESYLPALALSYDEIRKIVLSAENLSSISRVNFINREITKIIEANITPAWGAITNELEDIAVYESSYAAGLLAATTAATIKTPAKAKVVDYIRKSLMSLHSGDADKVGTWAEYVRGNTKGTADSINNIVKASYVRGDTVQQTTRAIKTAVQGMVKNSAETLARTATQHYANQAREAMYDDNLDVIESFYYSATLDNRTTIFCAGNDGKSFKVGQPRPQLPAHFNCRSSYIALTKGQTKPDGTRPAVGAGEDYERGAEYRGRRDSDKFKITQTKPGTTYEEWLHRQPADFQADVLGVKKSKLFREGLPLDKFTDMTGRPLTLDELKKFDSVEL